MSLANAPAEPKSGIVPAKVVLLADCSFSMAPKEKQAICTILRNFLQQMDFPFHSVPFDAAFADATVEDGLQHYNLRKEEADTPEFQRALNCGASIGFTMYDHLDIRAQYWIALWTTCLTFFDDLSVTDPMPLREFHSRFICAESQKHPLLDTFASLLRKAKEHFNPLAANLVISGSLDFVTAHVFDHDHKEMKIHKSAPDYPRYFRTMMGLATGFTVVTFPPHIPLDVYIQAMPNMVNLINDVNDIFSFYKEELEDEDTNHISLLARFQGWTKIQALQYLADLTIKGDRATKEILSANPEAYEIYTKALVPGYIKFHMAATKRYKLDDLDLAP